MKESFHWLDNIDYKVTLKLTLPSDTGLYNWAVNPETYTELLH